MANLDYAKKWCDALSGDTDAFVELYAPDTWFTADYYALDDHMIDTATDRAMLHEKLDGLANGQNGTHTFTATEFLGDENGGLIHWDYTVEGADTYRGIETKGKTLKTRGSTYLDFDKDGKIIMDSTVFNDTYMFQQLGLPVATPHYWEEGFDMENPGDVGGPDPDNLTGYYPS